ncbi:MAG: CYTH domain-containing protein [Mollicutes bacterium]|nr:CYTH domain-containing protein [Mollicutes bacterium]
MSHIEYELRVLEIDEEQIKGKLKNLGATLVEEVFQRRYVYDFNPKKENKWIRLRTNGKVTTLAIKNIVSTNIDGTKELEIIVDDFDITNKILFELGYKPKGFQENKRITYDLNGTEIDIDTWPSIPTFLEIEGKNEKEVYDTLELLGISKEKTTTLGVQSIYLNFYNIDIEKDPNLSFDKEEC